MEGWKTEGWKDGRGRTRVRPGLSVLSSSEVRLQDITPDNLGRILESTSL